MSGKGKRRRRARAIPGREDNLSLPPCGRRPFFQRLRTGRERGAPVALRGLVYGKVILDSLTYRSSALWQRTCRLITNSYSCLASVTTRKAEKAYDQHAQGIFY